MKLIKILTPPIKASIIIVSVAAATLLFADTVVTDVSDNPGYHQLNAATDVQKLVANTVKQVEYPSSVGNPQFWFDCTQTNGWTFAADGGVAKIPSLVGGRYLTTDPEGGFHDYSWTPKNPVFEAASEGLDRPALDFGTKGSCRAMNFDKIVVEGGTSTNVLYNIGSIIAVWYSARGNSTYGGDDGQGTGDWGEGGYYGGAFLGGGYGTDGVAAADKHQYVLYRGGNDRMSNTGDVNRPRWYDTQIANSAHTHANIRYAHVRQNGQATTPMHAGLSADWEIVSVIPQGNYALMNATGLGMNDSRISAVSGGFKVAEMMIFDKKLTHEEAALIEAYLSRKWFGREVRGYNGNAVIGSVRSYENRSGVPQTIMLPVEAAAGEKLTIGKLTGGRGPGSKVVKTGAGALEIGDAEGYGGTVELQEGVLEFTRREVPSALPHDIYMHFDASDANSFLTDENGAFTCFRNLAAHNGWKMRELCARPTTTVPEVLKDELGPGLNMLDFGDYVKDDTTRMLYFATNEVEALDSVKVAPYDITTVIAVIGAQRGGGNILKQKNGAGYFSRNTSIPDRFDVAFNTNYTLENNLLAGDYTSLMVDGIPADRANQGYATPGYQVVAFQTPGSADMSGIGGGAWGAGGLRLGEIAIYRRVLTEQELKDGSAYLMRKWLNRTAPGYAPPADTPRTDIRTVATSSAAEIRVPSGTARIGKLTAAGSSIVKTGDGTLEVCRATAESIAVKGGALVKIAAPDVATDCELAAEPALHLDVTDADSMHVTDVNGERRVYEWYTSGDKADVLATIPHRMSDDSTKYNNYKFAPYLSSEVKLNGHETLDFGPFTVDAGGRALSLSRSLDAVRSAYVVWAPRDDSRGAFFGCSKGNGDTNGELYDFIRSSTDTNTAALVYNNGTSDHVRNGDIYVNGVKSAATMVPPAGEFMLAEFHPTCPAHISGIGTDRDVQRFAGGIRVAEVVVYERELSDREKIATRNYLMKKWFNAEPQELPPADDDTLEVYEIAVDGVNTVGGASDVSARRLNGSGELVKEGAGDLALGDLSGFAGTVAVNAGSLTLTGRRPAFESELPAAEDLLFHVDATKGLTTVTNADGTVEVTEWKSTLDDGWTARPFYDAHRPTLLRADDLKHNAFVVDMGKSGDQEAMRFYYNGETNLLEGIGSVLWMMGSHNGGGYLLGGGRHYNNWDGGLFNFMRGGQGGRCNLPEYPLLNEAWVCPDNLKQATWHIDGETVAPLKAGLSGGWDLVSMNITHKTSPTSNADGFGFDGRTVNNPAEYPSYMGCQRFAEVIMYKRKLTDEELLQAENYLRQKWEYKGTQVSPSNGVTVAIAEGATLDLGGNAQYLAGVSGTGTITNGKLTLGTLVADPLAESVLALDATLAFDEMQVIEVRNAAAIAAGRPVKILECTAVENLPSKRNLVFTGDTSWCESYRAKLVFADGALYLQFVPNGMLILVR